MTNMLPLWPPALGVTSLDQHADPALVAARVGVSNPGQAAHPQRESLTNAQLTPTAGDHKGPPRVRIHRPRPYGVGGMGHYGKTPIP
ncbi:MAG TPA: hypothetical protein VJ761_04945 [Ktedonobacteraceae bacterium]|nr:hypothetical protein [Ktedonobacteraceae bacterium]